MGRLVKIIVIAVVLVLASWKLWDTFAPHFWPELTDKGPWPYTNFSVKSCPPNNIKVHAFRLPPGSHKGIGTDSDKLKVLWYYRYSPTHLNRDDHNSIIEDIPFPMPASFKKISVVCAGKCSVEVSERDRSNVTYKIFEKKGNIICKLTLPNQWVYGQVGYDFNWIQNNQGKRIIVFLPKPLRHISHKFIFDYIEFLEHAE